MQTTHDTPDNLQEQCAGRLRRNGFEAVLVPDEKAAGAFIRERIETLAPSSVSFGDSMTLYATGTIDWLRSQNRYPLIDTFEVGVPFRQLIERRRQALLCDTFLTGINAVTLTGELHWLDMIGNRIAPIAFGPRHILLTVGRNKIVADTAAAYERIRTQAAPQNVARHEGMVTPCAKTGVCHDCSSPHRICNERLILHKCHPAGRITVILIDRDLGL